MTDEDESITDRLNRLESEGLDVTWLRDTLTQMRVLPEVPTPPRGTLVTQAIPLPPAPVESVAPSTGALGIVDMWASVLPKTPLPPAPNDLPPPIIHLDDVPHPDDIVSPAGEPLGVREASRRIRNLEQFRTRAWWAIAVIAMYAASATVVAYVNW